VLVVEEGTGEVGEGVGEALLPNGHQLRVAAFTGGGELDCPVGAAPVAIYFLLGLRLFWLKEVISYC
jgi:hypothetical protein